MPCKLTALFVCFFLLLRVRSIDLILTQSFPSLSDFDLPEIDGSAVDDICRTFTVPTPEPITTTTTTTSTTSPITRKVVTTTKKPAARTTLKKPQRQSPGTPIRKQPAPGQPITNPAARLLYHLLVNSRGKAGLNSFMSLPIGGLPLGGDSTSSQSDELMATLLRRSGRTNRNRWRIGVFSSDSSDD
ncbi:hypothetical protein PAMP_016021 [Pampus punctatissimus]